MERTAKKSKKTDSVNPKWRGTLMRRGDAIAIGVILVALMVVGTLLDYSLDAALYHPGSKLGLVLAGYGQLPSSAGAVMAGTLFLIGRSRKNRAVGILECLIGLVMIAVGVYMLCENPVEYMEMNLAVSCVIAVVITVLMIMLAVFVSRKAGQEDILLAAFVFLLTIVLQMVIINIIKVPWGRPRMRLVETDARAYFMPWYHPGTALKNALVSAGAEAEEFKSFPSGHTGHAVILMLYGLLPWLRSGGSRDADAKGAGAMSFVPSVRLFIWIGFAWGWLVAFSRMIMGAHFLTDTTIGFAVSFLCVLFIPVLVFRIRQYVQERAENPRKSHS